MEIDSQLETKAGLPPEALVTHGEMMRAFEQLKEANDQRLAEIGKRHTDPLLEEKVARINETVSTHQRQLDDINLKQARPQLGSAREVPPHEQREHKAA